MRTDKDGTLKYSAGWIYLRALLKMGKSLMQGPKLFDFQGQVLLCAFLNGSAVPHLTWLVSGVGLRSAQEIGIHVRSILLHADPVERALYNRAFWCLYHIDRQNCAAIGRSVAMQDTDFDADYPIAVDDEFWETSDPARNFKQPDGAGVPKVAAFIHTLKLTTSSEQRYAPYTPSTSCLSIAQIRSVNVQWSSSLTRRSTRGPTQYPMACDGIRPEPINRCSSNPHCSTRITTTARSSCIDRSFPLRNIPRPSVFPLSPSAQMPLDLSATFSMPFSVAVRNSVSYPVAR